MNAASHDIKRILNEWSIMYTVPGTIIIKYLHWSYVLQIVYAKKEVDAAVVR